MKCRWLRLVAGFSLLAALFLYADACKLVTVTRNVAPGWLVAAALCVTTATLMGAFNLHLIVNCRGEVTLWRFLPIYWTAWAVGLIVPGQVGDLASLSALLRKQGLAWHDSLGRSLLDKALSFVVMLLLALIALFPYVALITPWVVVIAVVASLFWLLSKLRVSRTWRELAARLLEPVLRELLATWRRHPRLLLMNFLLTWVKIGLTGLSYWCIFRSLGFDSLGFFEVLPPMAASSLVAYLPVTFNGLGTVELTGMALFAAIGLPEEGVLIAYLLLRLLVYTLAWAPAGLWLLTRR